MDLGFERDRGGPSDGRHRPSARGEDEKAYRATRFEGAPLSRSDPQRPRGRRIGSRYRRSAIESSGSRIPRDRPRFAVSLAAFERQSRAHAVRPRPGPRWQPDLVVLARYMQVLTPEIVVAFRNRILNIHPSLLPYYPGANAYKQAFEAGVRVCGCTAHMVTEDLDEGPIVLQDVFHIEVGQDSLEEVKLRGRELEAEVLSKAVGMFVREELVVTDSKVLFRPGRLS
ncbi:MAG: hypothetical protein E4H00_06915 [Myxococcales bacterium]|nr:MAG: hypothetical protein E4H00_06915 [Myxococcales bacterium]